MPFGNKNSNDGKTQADAVEDAILTAPGLSTNELQLPGLQWVLSMSEEELIDFFVVALRMRSNVRELDFSLGDYKYKESQSRIPGARNIHEKSFREAATIIAMALQQDPKVIGVRVTTTKVDDNYVSIVYVKIANKEPQGPQRAKGKLISGDAEYNPKLIVSYSSAI